MKVPLSPLQLTWDITNRCPARCIHCYNASDRDGGSVGDWSPELVEGVLEDIVRTRPPTLGIRGGDPLVLKELPGLARAIYGLAGPHMPSVVIGTNGFLLSRQRDLIRTIVEVYSETPGYFKSPGIRPVVFSAGLQHGPAKFGRQEPDRTGETRPGLWTLHRTG